MTLRRIIFKKSIFEINCDFKKQIRKDCSKVGRFGFSVIVEYENVGCVEVRGALEYSGRELV